jgi:hypothetical protein
MKEVASMRRIMSMVTVALLMAAMVVAMATPAFADANDNDHTCTAVIVTTNTPDDFKGGLEGDNASGQAKAGERGENLSSFLELVANCGDNR